MKNIYAHPLVVAALEDMERLEKLAHAVLAQDLSARAKLARIRLLRKEAESRFGKLKTEMRAQHGHSKKQ
jgi:hypothetical protein